MNFFKAKNPQKDESVSTLPPSLDKELYEVAPLEKASGIGLLTPDKDLCEIPPLAKDLTAASPPSEQVLEELDTVLEELELKETEAQAVVETMSLGLENFSLDDLLRKCLDISASDIHLETGSPPIFRIRGDMVYSDAPLLTQEKMEEMCFPLLNESQLRAFDEAGNLDFAYEIKELARFRVNMLKQYHGLGAVFRIIPEKIPSMEDLKLPEVLKKICMFSRGIVIVTGPTGSGKSTTLAAMINYINQNRKSHIITIEDPIEFTHKSKNCLIDHREVGSHTKSFAEALRASLREDPNIILVGEMRDFETISMAITAAEMGSLVFGTLHTNSAAKTIDRIIDVFPAKQQEQVKSQVSQALRAIIAQQLMKNADGKGRVAAIEVLLCNTSVSNLIREGKTGQIPSFMQMGATEGMQTMDSALISLVKSGTITAEAALSRALDLTNFKRAGIQA
jgi:twitching motility protein PilT